MVTLGATKDPKKKEGNRPSKKRDEEVLFSETKDEDRKSYRYDRSKKRED